jgi:asparagine synthase (glutamine-hydrolysing)
VRFPLLDERVLNFALAIPPVPWCQRKELLRVTMRDALPAEVLVRSKTPVRGYDERQVRQWREVRGPAHVRFGSRIAEYVDVRAVSSTLHEGDTGDVVAAWRALMLERWLRTLEGGPSAATLTQGS